MQGFLRTSAGLRPVLLEGIEEVTYTSNSGLNNTGTLAIKYIPNSGTGTGNIFINIPAYSNLQYPIERFWDWVGAISGGDNKTFNSFLGSGVIIGSVVGTVTTQAGIGSAESYIISVDSSESIDNICDLVFDTNATVESGVSTPNYTNVLTNGQAAPAVFDQVWISNTQGYDPFGATAFGNVFPSPTQGALPDGTYALLSGTPKVISEKGGGVIEQSGTIYRIVMKNGIISSTQVCPQSFDVMELKGWIRDNFSEPFPASNSTCAQIAYTAGAPLSLNDWQDSTEKGSKSGAFFPVTFAFDFAGTEAVPQLGDLEDPSVPFYTCSYGGGVFEQNLYVPVGAKVYVKGAKDTAYVPFQNGNFITWSEVGVEVTTVSINSLQSYGAMYTEDPSELSNARVFKIDWGAAYPDEKGADLSCPYFRADDYVFFEGEPDSTNYVFSQFLASTSNGTVGGWASFPCIGGAGAS